MRVLEQQVRHAEQARGAVAFEEFSGHSGREPDNPDRSGGSQESARPRLRFRGLLSLSSGTQQADGLPPVAV
jgi:hypothetical protein